MRNMITFVLDSLKCFVACDANEFLRQYEKHVAVRRVGVFSDYFLHCLSNEESQRRNSQRIARSRQHLII